MKKKNSDSYDAKKKINRVVSLTFTIFSKIIV